MASPPLLRGAAARLDAQAGVLPHTLERVGRVSGVEVWRGPAADRFGGELRLRRQRVADVAGRLRATASRLRQQADTVEADAGRGAGGQRGGRAGAGVRVA